MDIEISTFLAKPGNARFQKYQRQARRYALHAAYANVPIDSIFKQLAFDDVDAGGVDDEVERRRAAQRQGTRGSGFRKPPVSDTEKVGKMGFRDPEFGKLRERIGSGETINLEEE